ncbi:alpha/beta hydrolase [Kibdelosporangium philippinense]|uniref:Alpha/beta hydrolase n=1 Tax=Kibdelosporangium philippinense TaxID=211113 RepID=A0ABS8ZEK3_9PSEU|nr:alpha/beta hydrolase [Kibdelosporangium philippinense]MCE7004953.1 alpha/beta hydrolase [Kibdelosporangium philippinense]
MHRQRAVNAERIVAERTARQAPTVGRMLAYAPPATMEISNAPVCAQWPLKPNDRFTSPFTARTATPIVVVGTTGDTATPYQQAVSLSRTLGNARLVTTRGEGHAAYWSDPCVRQAVDRFFLTGEAPADGTVCVQPKAL